MAVRGKIDDSQPSKAERYPGRGIDPNAIVIGPAVSDRPAHAYGYALKFLGIPASTGKHSRQAAHIESAYT
jgi:hypothetical protein